MKPTYASIRDEVKIKSSTPGEEASKGNHSQPLQTDLARKKALAEQSKLQNNPDALPVTGYPVSRPASSPTANTEDAD